MITHHTIILPKGQYVLQGNLHKITDFRLPLALASLLHIMTYIAK